MVSKLLEKASPRVLFSGTKIPPFNFFFNKNTIFGEMAKNIILVCILKMGIPRYAFLKWVSHIFFLLFKKADTHSQNG